MTGEKQYILDWRELAVYFIGFIIIFGFALAHPVFAVSSSNSSCIDNTTLREYNNYVFQITENTTDNINFTQYKDVICENGCIATGNNTAVCQPQPMENYTWLGLVAGGVLMFFIVAYLLLKRL